MRPHYRLPCAMTIASTMLLSSTVFGSVSLFSGASAHAQEYRYPPTPTHPFSTPSPWSIKSVDDEQITIWDAPLIPTGMSVLLPGSGQVYTSNIFGENKDWFALGRGAGYMALTALGASQLSSAIARDDGTAMWIWGLGLAVVCIISPVDAYVTSSGRNQEKVEQVKRQELQRVESQRTRDKQLLKQAQQLAEQNQYEKALHTLTKLSPSTQKFSIVQAWNIQWKQELVHQHAQQIYDHAYELAKQGDFTKAVELVKQVPADMPVSALAQQKAMEWQRIIDERAAKALYEQALARATQGNIAKAIELLQGVGQQTSYYPKAQKKIAEYKALIKKITAP